MLRRVEKRGRERVPGSRRVPPRRDETRESRRRVRRVVPLARRETCFLFLPLCAPRGSARRGGAWNNDATSAFAKPETTATSSTSSDVVPSDVVPSSFKNSVESFRSSDPPRPIVAASATRNAFAARRDREKCEKERLDTRTTPCVSSSASPPCLGFRSFAFAAATSAAVAAETRDDDTRDPLVSRNLSFSARERDWSAVATSPGFFLAASAKRSLARAAD